MTQPPADPEGPRVPLEERLQAMTDKVNQLADHIIHLIADLDDSTDVLSADPLDELLDDSPEDGEIGPEPDSEGMTDDDIEWDQVYGDVWREQQEESLPRPGGEPSF